MFWGKLVSNAQLHFGNFVLASLDHSRRTGPCALPISETVAVRIPAFENVVDHFQFERQRVVVIDDLSCCRVHPLHDAEIVSLFATALVAFAVGQILVIAESADRSCQIGVGKFRYRRYLGLNMGLDRMCRHSIDGLRCIYRIERGCHHQTDKRHRSYTGRKQC